MRAFNFRPVFGTIATLLCVVSAGHCPPTAKAEEDKPAAVVPASAPKIKAAEQLGDDRYAVIVGVNDYVDEKIPDLRLAERDAQAVYDLLTNASIGGVATKNATLLLGKSATTRKVKSALSKLREVSKKSTVFLYFSGHGMKDRGDGFWMTQDAEVDDLLATALSDLELRKLLGGIQAERVVVMIDACYAAATVHGSKDAPKGLNDLLSTFTGKGHAILSAAGDGEEALEAASLKHSVFTYFLLEGLKGQADANRDGVVVLPELTTYLDDHVADEARKRRGIQKPVVDFKEVQEPAKFQLVIDPVRLAAISAAATNRQATFDRRMAKVRELLLDDELTDDQAREAKALFGADPAKLNKDDLLVLAEYVNVIEGKLAPEKLAKAIGLIRSTPPPTPTDPWAGTKAGDVREDNSLKLQLVWCPPGKFTMGSPKSEIGRDSDEDQVTATLSQGFWLGRTEVTQQEWQAVMNTTPWKGARYVEEGHDYPATCVTWNDAIEFCRKLTERERNANRLPAEWEYTLPTEAQWEYACRAGTTTTFSFGDDDAKFGDYAWYGGLIGDGNARTEKYAHRVGLKQPNAWGLRDMHGNVWEWCRDWYLKTLPGANDPVVTVQTPERAARGSAWFDAPRGCRSATRDGHSPESADSTIGFRLAASPSSRDSLISARVTTTPTPATVNSSGSWIGTNAGDVREDNSLKLKLIWCPPGSFTMGSPKSETNRSEDEDQVAVILTKGFWLGRTEVTQKEWQAVIGYKPWSRESYVKEGDEYAATYVSWEDATEFCRKLTDQERKAGRLPAGWEYTLPTEAQWEYACRAGTKTQFSFGDDESKLGQYAWWGGIALPGIQRYGNAKTEKYAHQVGTKLPNPWGLRDMHGNVKEWCRDWYAEKLPGGENPEVTRLASNRVDRGGVWDDSPRRCRSAFRGSDRPGFRWFNLGFRVAASPSGK